MTRLVKIWLVLALVSVLSLAVGYSLPRPPRRGGDMMDAVAAVQRRAPHFLISEPRPSPNSNWARAGTVYLCSGPRTAAEVDCLNKCPRAAGHRWVGVVCFKGWDVSCDYFPWLEEGGDRCLHFGEFVAFGDPELLKEIGAILMAEGFTLTSD